MNEVTPKTETLQLRVDIITLPPNAVVDHLQLIVQIQREMFLVPHDELVDLTEHVGRALAQKLQKLYQEVHAEAQRRKDAAVG